MASLGMLLLRQSPKTKPNLLMPTVQTSNPRRQQDICSISYSTIALSHPRDKDIRSSREGCYQSVFTAAFLGLENAKISGPTACRLTCHSSFSPQGKKVGCHWIRDRQGVFRHGMPQIEVCFSSHSCMPVFIKLGDHYTRIGTNPGVWGTRISISWEVGSLCRYGNTDSPT